MLERKVIYTFQARWAKDFYKGRVTLGKRSRFRRSHLALADLDSAGDSLHLMPPFIGQGLNSGFRDAAALAWRMPLMLSGLAQPELLLQSYQSERMEHIRKLTVRWYRLLSSLNTSLPLNPPSPQEHCILLGEVICETDFEKSKKMHQYLRDFRRYSFASGRRKVLRLAAAPENGYDPPLGQPGILTTQSEAGRLSLQRTIRVKKGLEAAGLFDEVFGYGWILLTISEDPLEAQLDPVSHRFFCEDLKGKCISIRPEQDHEAEYQRWFATAMRPGDVVLIRPDFYVFGHCPQKDLDTLLRDLRTKIGAK